MVAFRWTLALVAVAGLSIAGCGGSGSGDSPADSHEGEEHAGHDHDHEGHAHADPKDLHEATEELAEMRDELAAAYKAGDTGEADNVIHEMGEMAEKAKTLLASSDLDRYAQSDVSGAIEQILNVLSTLHEESHGSDAKIDPATYEGQQDAMNDAITSLQKHTEKPETAEAE